MDLGQRLKSERERLGMNQTEFAALAGASKHAQINWEKGVAAPNATALAAWASAGLDVLFVVTGQRAIPVEAAPSLTSEETSLLADYHGSSSGDRAAIRQLAKSVSKAPTVSGAGAGRRRAAGGSK